MRRFVFLMIPLFLSAGDVGFIECCEGIQHPDNMMSEPQSMTMNTDMYSGKEFKTTGTQIGEWVGGMPVQDNQSMAEKNDMKMQMQQANKMHHQNDPFNGYSSDF